MIRMCLMSVQSVLSAPAAADTGAARKRSAGADSGEASEPFALPDDNEAPAANAAAKAPAAAEAKPVVGKAEAPVKAAPPAAQAGPAAAPAPEAPVPAPATPPAAVSTQAAASALFTAAIAAQADAPVAKDTETSAETAATKEGDEAAAGVVDPAALLMIAMLPAEPAKPIAAGPAANASGAAALAAAAAVAGGAPVAPLATDAAIAAAGAAAPAADGAAALLAAESPIAAAPGTPVAPKAPTTLPLQGGDADTPKSDNAGKTDAMLTAGHPIAHSAKGGAGEPATPVAAQDAAPSEFKISEILQPLQGAIDFSTAVAHARSAGFERPLATMTPEQAAAQAANTQAQSAASTPPTPLHVVPIEIGLRALAGGRKFDIRLDPAELGRVDVSLDISDKGEVTARLVVDRVETLHMLQRDARTLERAFEQAGLKPSNAGVEITLRDPGDQSGFRQNRQQDDAPRRTRGVTDLGDDIGVTAAQPVPSTTIRGLVRLGGVDLSI